MGVAPTMSDIMEKIQSYSPDADLKPVMTAYLLAARAHAGQVRKSGEPYLTHPMSVAMILAEMRMDVDTVATALLHDALEDNPITKEEMEAEIGPIITSLVDGVTKIGKLRYRSREELAAENFRKMMMAMSQDLRVILVKLADRLHNVSTLEFHKPEKRAQIANETLEIFVPIANRLGLERVKSQLEDHCFLALFPEEYARIEAFLLETQSDREDYTARVIESLHDKLADQQVAYRVSGRAKDRFSIYRKVNEQCMSLQEVSDLSAFRVIVEDLGSCYAVLGTIHASFPPVPERIKDYIARPKPNGYQSLHTTVIGPEGRRIEVQIRTEEMHRVAEEGIAAHWRYKEGHLALSAEDVLRISKVRDVFEAARYAESATEFMEAVKVEFYADEVFVFTPAGDVKRFPQGATALDFAFAVHTDVGMRCTGAKVNGRMVALRYALQSGDSVEILTSESQCPTRDWLKIARTGRALQKIRRHLRIVEREQGVRLGRDILEADLRRQGWSIKRLNSEGLLKVLLKDRGYSELDSMLVDVARGAVSVRSLIGELLPDEPYQPRQPDDGSAITSLLNRFRKPTQSPVLISGEDGVLVSFARCCGPLPGESVIGFITRGRGITVHRSTCPQLQGMDPDRHISVEWDDAAADRHNGEIEIYCTNRPGMLANITKICEQNGVNINRAEARTGRDSPAVVTLELALRDISELARLIKNIEKIDGVEAVLRTAG